MRIWRMTSVVSAAPGGASMPGTEMTGPPGCASGTGGRWNRSRSLPGWSLGGTICAPGGTTCATAANETLTIAKAAAMARTPASIPRPLGEWTGNFTRGGESGQSRAGALNRRVLAIFADVSIRSHRDNRAPGRPRHGRATKGELFVGLNAGEPIEAGVSKRGARAAPVRRDAGWHPLVADEAGPSGSCDAT